MRKSILVIVILVYLDLFHFVFAQGEMGAPINLPPGQPQPAQPSNQPPDNNTAPNLVNTTAVSVPPPASPFPVTTPANPPPPQTVAETAPSPQNLPPPSPPVSQTQSQADAAQFQTWLNQLPTRTTPASPPPLGQPVPPPPRRRLIVERIVDKPRVLVVARPKCGQRTPLVVSPPLSYRESQEIMLKSAPSEPIPPDPEAEVAFNSLLRQNVPLSPQQVVRLRQFIDNSQRAAAIPPTIPPKPVSSTLMINLSPGTTPPAIRIAQGYVSTIVFVDSLGLPWPIASYDIGDPKASTIQWDGKSNILLIQAVSPYSDSNFVVRLMNLQTPITLELVSGQRVVDYRTDIHVPGVGPNSKDIPVGISTLPESANQILLSVLDGVAPSGSRQLSVKGGEAQAWFLGDRIYFRTRLTVLSPGWTGKMSSPDGMMAYELPRTSSILVSQYGNPVELRVEGF